MMMKKTAKDWTLPSSFFEGVEEDAVAIKGIKGSRWEVGGNRDGNLGIPEEISNRRDQSKSLSPTEVKSDDWRRGRGVCGNYKRKLKFSCSPELYSDDLNPTSHNCSEILKWLESFPFQLHSQLWQYLPAYLMTTFHPYMITHMCFLWMRKSPMTFY